MSRKPPTGRGYSVTQARGIGPRFPAFWVGTNEGGNILDIIDKKMDPRPDLGEAERWSNLLQLAFSEHEELGAGLHGMRCYGTQLTWTMDGRPKLTPVIGPGCWETKDEYDSSANTYLRPHKDALVKCLAQLAEMESLMPSDVGNFYSEDSPWPHITGKTVFVARDRQSREAMQKACPWAWVFNQGEIPTISRMGNVEFEFLLRGKTGSVFGHEKEKEKWDGTTG